MAGRLMSWGGRRCRRWHSQARRGRDGPGGRGARTASLARSWRCRTRRCSLRRYPLAAGRPARLAIMQVWLCPGRYDARRWGQGAGPRPGRAGSGRPGPSAARGLGSRRLSLGGPCRPGCWPCRPRLCRPRPCGPGLLGRLSALQAVAFCPAADAVRLRFLDARGVARNADPHGQGELEALFVSKAELSCQLVHPDLLGQVFFNPFLRVPVRHQ